MRILKNDKGMSTITVVLVVTAALIFLIASVAQRWSAMTNTHRKWRERVSAHLATKQIAGIIRRAYDVGTITTAGTCSPGKFYTISGINYCFQTTTPASAICFENPLTPLTGTPGALVSPICLRDLNGTLITDASTAHKGWNVARLWNEGPSIAFHWLSPALGQSVGWLPSISAIATSTLSAPACAAPTASSPCVVCGAAPAGNADCSLITFCLDGTTCANNKTYRQRFAFIR